MTYFEIEQTTTADVKDNKIIEKPMLRVKTQYTTAEIELWYKGVITIKIHRQKGTRSYFETLDLPIAPLQKFFKKVQTQ
jgi:hypothetical protein